MEKELWNIGRRCYLLGFKYLTKDSDGDIHVWEDVPVLEDGIWLDSEQTGFAWGREIDKLGKFVERGKLRPLEDITE